MNTAIDGFSKLSKSEKIAWLTKNYTKDPISAQRILEQYWNQNSKLQGLHDEFIENTITNYYLPFGIAPNFLINGRLYAVPMAIEESSVVAAASKAAKFWLGKGGFKAQVLGTEKIGQVHFMFKGEYGDLKKFFEYVKPKLVSAAKPLTRNMEKRGGGVTRIELRNKTHELEHYYQLHCTFQTQDAMGANFINSCLEEFAKVLKSEAQIFLAFPESEREIEVVMSILSNYVPDCLVRAEVQCPVGDLETEKSIAPHEFARKMVQAVDIAKIEPYRAVTHNKGIMNGVDAVVLATGNDFRAIEAAAHAYASKSGRYSSLTHASLENDVFKFWIEIPLALGTVGGLTNLHPLVKLSLEILQDPSAVELMQIVAVAGLAQNYAALSSLVTTGIQQGHMKMHLMNILNQMGATEAEKKELVAYFKSRTVSHTTVKEALGQFRENNGQTVL